MSVLIKGVDKPEDCHKCPCIQTFGDKFLCGVTGDDVHGLHICPMEKAPEPKKGKWIDVDPYGHSGVVFKCTECENVNLRETDYCPNCGARMEKE